MIESDGDFFRMSFPAYPLGAARADAVALDKAMPVLLSPTDTAAKPLIQLGENDPMGVLIRLRPDTDRMVAGAACVPEADVQGEWVEPSGLILTYFKKQGRINWHHSKNPADIVGHPVKYVLTPAYFYVWAHLAVGIPTAEAAFRLADAGFDPTTLAVDPNQTELAWSVEGRTLERDPKNDKRITKAIVINLALSPNPVCPDTFALRAPAGSDALIWPDRLVKSLGAWSPTLLVSEPEAPTVRAVLATHYQLATDGECGCLQLDGPNSRFVSGYAGAVGHFFNCCSAGVDMARDLAQKHADLARETGRLAKGAYTDG